MKKLIVALSFTTLLIACKKDKTTDFTATDVTGTSIVKGNVNKTIITPNTTGGWITTSVAAAKGVNVTVKVNRNSLYPGSSASGADVYTATTDSAGNYSIPVKTNATGVAAVITVDGYTATQDTLINGITKKGLLVSYQGTSVTDTLVIGRNLQFDYKLTALNIVTNPITFNTGTAIVTGSVGVSFIKEVMTGTTVINSSVIVPLAGAVVYMNFNKDPNLLAVKLYSTTTDASGYYFFNNINTVAAGTAGFSQIANVWIPDYAATRDTIKIGGSITTGRAGVFQMQSTTENGIYNNTIRNAVHINYFNFVVN